MRMMNLRKKTDLYYSVYPNYEANISYHIGKDFMDQVNCQLVTASVEKALKNDEDFVLALDELGISHRQKSFGGSDPLR